MWFVIDQSTLTRDNKISLQWLRKTSVSHDHDTLLTYISRTLRIVIVHGKPHTSCFINGLVLDHHLLEKWMKLKLKDLLICPWPILVNSFKFGWKRLSKTATQQNWNICYSKKLHWTQMRWTQKGSAHFINASWGEIWTAWSCLLGMVLM